MDRKGFFAFRGRHLLFGAFLFSSNFNAFIPLMLILQGISILRLALYILAPPFSKEQHVT